MEWHYQVASSGSLVIHHGQRPHIIGLGALDPATLLHLLRCYTAARRAIFGGCDQQKDPEQNLRAVIQRILAKSDSAADEGVGASSSQQLH